jgi:hypothetical protein
MASLEALKPNASVRGILPTNIVTVVNVQWFGCQSASKNAPGSASKIDPPVCEGRGRLALARAELVGVAQPGRARFGKSLASFASQARFLKRQLSFPVSTMSQ